MLASAAKTSTRPSPEQTAATPTAGIPAPNAGSGTGASQTAPFHAQRHTRWSGPTAKTSRWLFPDEQALGGPASPPGIGGSVFTTAHPLEASSVSSEPFRPATRVAGQSSRYIRGSTEASPAKGAAPLAVSFDGTSSSDAEGTVASWSWDFGDGSTGAGPRVTHTYGAPGHYFATLTVTDDQDARDAFATEVVVQAPNAYANDVLATPGLLAY